MTTLYHEIEVVTSTERVWNLLTTKAGLNRWWPEEVSIQGGDSWRFLATELGTNLIFRVVEEESEQTLEWLCTQGHEDWHNTLVHWRVEKDISGLRLIMEHRDLRLSQAQAATLNTHWGIMMNRLHEQLHLEIDTMDDRDLNAWT